MSFANLWKVLQPLSTFSWLHFTLAVQFCTSYTVFVQRLQFCTIYTVLVQSLQFCTSYTICEAARTGCPPKGLEERADVAYFTLAAYFTVFVCLFQFVFVFGFVYFNLAAYFTCHLQTKIQAFIECSRSLGGQLDFILRAFGTEAARPLRQWQRWLDISVLACRLYLPADFVFVCWKYQKYKSVELGDSG